VAANIVRPLGIAATLGKLSARAEGWCATQPGPGKTCGTYVVVCTDPPNAGSPVARDTSPLFEAACLQQLI